jgi:CheY-like chemotaxis protein
MLASSLPIVAVVDDDSIYQFTATKTLQLTKAASDVLSFISGELALAYLREHQHNADRLPDYLFLDINMPMMDGWMFLDDFEKFADQLAKPVKIFMVSSSIDPKDIARASAHQRVAQYLTKPVSIKQLSELLAAA